MGKAFLSLLKKDFRLMISSRFLLLALGSLVLYSCYINFVYVKMEQDIYPVYLYDPHGRMKDVDPSVIKVKNREEMQAECGDGYSVGIDASGTKLEIYLVESGVETMDNHRAAYAASMLSSGGSSKAVKIGRDNKEMKNRREITCEVLFFELAAVGFLGLASMLFKEKQMGVIRVHGVLPVSRTVFILSKLSLFLLCDLIFAACLTFINLGFPEGIAVMPMVFVQTGILSLIMALVGFFCSLRLADFRQFSLLYLVLAVFITTPVFLAGQTAVEMDWIRYHPMYHMFMAMKNAYFRTPSASVGYYLWCGGAIFLLLLLVRHQLICEMEKEG